MKNLKVTFLPETKDNPGKYQRQYNCECGNEAFYFDKYDVYGCLKCNQYLNQFKFNPLKNCLKFQDSPIFQIIWDIGQLLFWLLNPKVANEEVVKLALEKVFPISESMAQKWQETNKNRPIYYNDGNQNYWHLVSADDFIKEWMFYYNTKAPTPDDFCLFKQ